MHLVPGDCEKTDFILWYGLFEFTGLSLKLYNTPITFQYLMNSVMHEYIDKFVLVYLDNVLVYSNHKDEH